MDDLELTRSLAADLDGTFPLLVDAHLDRCYSIALRLLGQPADAEEVAQDVLVRAYRALATYDAARIRELRLRPWLAAIAVNLARNRRRRYEDRIPPLPLTRLLDPDGESRAAIRSLLDDGTPAPEDVVLRHDDHDRWARLLLALPDRYRIPLVLRHVDELSYAEMAETLGRSEGTLKSQVHRGLQLLRAAWEAVEREEAIA
jgi:RNA polymerase sigma factor (sigma-70 family)